MKNQQEKNSTEHSGFSRRDFIRSAGLTVLGASASPLIVSSCDPSREPENIPVKGQFDFPDGFEWGTATASYQVEGAANVDGRGKSIWDVFSHTKGKVLNNDNGDVACDMYHRYKDDVQLMKALHAKVYRFSVAWPRIFPDGTGTPNEKGMDFYNRLVDELLANGIEPYATMYHWDLPQALQDKYKGWASRETAKAFGDYAGYVAEKLSDRVKNFFTLNECRTFVELGYGLGIFAPGIKASPAQLNQVRHHAVLAHGFAVQAIRARARAGSRVGPAENLSIAVPISETPENIMAAQIATRELNAPYLTVMLEGKYTDNYLKNAGKDAPVFTEEDLKIISSPVDITGINVYMPEKYVVAAQNNEGYAIIPYAKSHPHTTSSWHMIGPESLYWGPRFVHELWKQKEIYITENGCSAIDELTKENAVNDTDRIMFIRNYLTQLHRATSQGVPVKGYFYWSLLDNFEWASGFGTRFGLHYTDYRSLKRIPKLSADYFRSVIKNNKVM